jgi:(p)ppGpp synthase/HD superfamily hydrolase
VAAALLHAAVEGGTLDEKRLRAEIGGQVADLIPALGDDAELSSFEDRKRALRRRFAPSGS